MSIAAGPDIVESNLILHLDAANAKSYSGSGAIWTDLSSEKSNGALGTTTQYNSSGYFQFDGLATSRSSTTNTSYPTSWSQPVTFEVFAYFDSDGAWDNGFYGGIIARGSTVGTLGLARANSNNVVGIWTRDNVGAAAAVGTIPGRDQWVHIVGTWDGIDKVQCYINGKFTGIQTKQISGTIDVGNYAIGGLSSTLSGGAGNTMKGRLSLIRIYNKALSDGEILKNFNAMRGRYGI